MARPATQTTQRYSGGYIRDIPERGKVKLPPSPPPEAPEEEEGEEEKRPTGDIPEPPLTKSGRPDRRFLGARHLPPSEEPENPYYRRARVGGMIGDIHVTISGKPDRRFKENRSLSNEEVMSQWVEVLNQRYRQH